MSSQEERLSDVAPSTRDDDWREYYEDTSIDYDYDSDIEYRQRACCEARQRVEVIISNLSYVEPGESTDEFVDFCKGIVEELNTIKLCREAWNSTSSCCYDCDIFLNFFKSERHCDWCCEREKFNNTILISLQEENNEVNIPLFCEFLLICLTSHRPTACFHCQRWASLFDL